MNNRPVSATPWPIPIFYIFMEPSLYKFDNLLYVNIKVITVKLQLSSVKKVIKVIKSSVLNYVDLVEGIP